MAERGKKGLGTFFPGEDGLWHGFLPAEHGKKIGSRPRVHIKRRERQDALYLYLKARAEKLQSDGWLPGDGEPETAAEWFWIWIADGGLRKRAGIFPHHVRPFHDYVLPKLDERRLQDLDPTHIAQLLNEVPTFEGKQEALRVFEAALRSACDLRWVRDVAAGRVRIDTTRAPLVSDEIDELAEDEGDPGVAVVWTPLTSWLGRRAAG